MVYINGQGAGVSQVAKYYFPYQRGALRKSRTFYT